MKTKRIAYTLLMFFILQIGMPLAYAFEISSADTIKAPVNHALMDHSKPMEMLDSGDQISSDMVMSGLAMSGSGDCCGTEGSCCIGSCAILMCFQSSDFNPSSSILSSLYTAHVLLKHTDHLYRPPILI